MPRSRAYEETVKLHGALRAAWLGLALLLLAQAGYMGWRFYLASLGPVGCDWRPGATVGGVAVLLFALYAAFGALRIRVDEERLRVGFGPFGTTVAASSIERAEPCSYSKAAYGGWGVRGGFDGTLAYTVLGDGGRGVRVQYRNKKGRRRMLLMSSAHPDELSGALSG